jgi:hypothetical protein
MRKLSAKASVSDTSRSPTLTSTDSLESPLAWNALPNQAEIALP